MKSTRAFSELHQFWNHQISRTEPGSIPPLFRRAVETAFLKHDWSEVGKHFREKTFVGPSGDFVMVGPYRTLRQGEEIVLPLGLVGKVLRAEDFSALARAAESWLKTPVERMSPILPVFVTASTDSNSERGEAFIVPDGWQFEDADHGPALNNMTIQQRRLEYGAKAALYRIFEPDTADLLVRALKTSSPDWALQHREFSYHEVGHATGLGLKAKLKGGALATPWYRGVEEWRADGIAFELMARTLTVEEAGRTIAANFALRFGVDSQRNGGIERDTDVNASLLTFEALLNSGSLRIGTHRKLELSCPNYEGLLLATEKMRADALHLTRREGELSCVQGIWGLYGSVLVGPGSRRIFQGLVVDPCRGIFTELP